MAEPKLDENIVRLRDVQHTGGQHKTSKDHMKIMSYSPDDPIRRRYERDNPPANNDVIQWGSEVSRATHLVAEWHDKQGWADRETPIPGGSKLFVREFIYESDGANAGDGASRVCVGVGEWVALSDQLAPKQSEPAPIRLSLPAELRGASVQFAYQVDRGHSINITNARVECAKMDKRLLKEEKVEKRQRKRKAATKAAAQKSRQEAAAEASRIASQALHVKRFEPVQLPARQTHGEDKPLPPPVYLIVRGAQRAVPKRIDVWSNVLALLPCATEGCMHAVTRGGTRYCCAACQDHHEAGRRGAVPHSDGAQGACDRCKIAAVDRARNAEWASIQVCSIATCQRGFLKGHGWHGACCRLCAQTDGDEQEATCEPIQAIGGGTVSMRRKAKAAARTERAVTSACRSLYASAMDSIRQLEAKRHDGTLAAARGTMLRVAGVSYEACLTLYEAALKLAQRKEASLKARHTHLETMAQRAYEERAAERSRRRSRSAARLKAPTEQLPSPAQPVPQHHRTSELGSPPKSQDQTAAPFPLVGVERSPGSSVLDELRDKMASGHLLTADELAKLEAHSNTAATDV